MGPAGMIQLPACPVTAIARCTLTRYGHSPYDTATVYTTASQATGSRAHGALPSASLGAGYRKARIQAQAYVCRSESEANRWLAYELM
jgi:hypothetical protein